MEISTGYVDTGELKLHYYRTGGNKPALVLSHGLTDDGTCWLPVAEALADQFDIIMPDARGHGKSDAPESGYTLENLAHELAAVIYKLEINKPYILGHSMGAITTLILAGLYPELPKAILLEDPPCFWSKSIRTRDRESINSLKKWISSNKRKTRDDLLAEFRKNNPHWAENELDPWINSKHRHSIRVTDLAHPVDAEALNFPKLFGNITCPVLFMHANPNLGAIAGEADISLLKEYIPHLQTAYFKDAGHCIRRDQYQEYLKVIWPFLRD